MRNGLGNTITLGIITVALLLAGSTAHAVDLADMTFNANATYDDVGGFVKSTITWELNNGAALTDPAGDPPGRVFIGLDGFAGEMTVTSTAGAPGSWTLPGNPFTAVRLGHDDAGEIGTLNVDGGVTMTVGHIFTEVAGQGFLNILDGTFILDPTLPEANPTDPLRNTAITIDRHGALIVPGTFADEVAFESGFSNSSVAATTQDLTLVFTTGQGLTTVTAIPEPGALVLLGLGGLMMLRRRCP